MRRELKTDPRTFEAVWRGTKLYEIRKDDRKYIHEEGGPPTHAQPYGVDDELLLCETRFSGEQMKGGRNLEYTGREVLCVVTHKLAGPVYGLAEGWCILGIRRVELIDKKGPHDGAHYRPDQPKDFANQVPQLAASGIGTVVGEAVKTRDPLFTPPVDLSAVEPPLPWVQQFGRAAAIKRMQSTSPLYCMGANCFSDGTTPHSAECIAEHEATTNPNGKYDHVVDCLTATALAVKWDDKGMPYCAAHGRNTHVMGCKTCEVTLHARCSIAKEGEDRRKADAPVAVERRAFSHYFRPTPYHGVDVYRILSIFEVVHPAIQHAIKKLLVAGKRGAKDTRKDWSEAVVSINRAIEMMDEDKLD